MCADHPVECLEQAIKRHSIARALRAEVSSDELAGLRATLVSRNEKLVMRRVEATIPIEVAVHSCQFRIGPACARFGCPQVDPVGADARRAASSK